MGEFLKIKISEYVFGSFWSIGFLEFIKGTESFFVEFSSIMGLIFATFRFIVWIYDRFIKKKKQAIL